SEHSTHPHEHHPDGHDHTPAATEAGIELDTASASAGGHHHEHHGHAGHGDHAEHAAAFGRLFWINLVLSIPVLLYSPTLQDWLRYSMPEFPGSDWIAPVLGTVVFIV